MRTRRAVLLAAAGAIGAAGAGAGGLLVHWWTQDPDQGYAVLSKDEAAIARAIAGAAFPPGEVVALDGLEADLDRYLDAMMATWPALTRDLMRTLLHLLNELPLVGEGASYLSLTRERRMDVLMGWLQGDQAELRAAVSSVVVLLGMGYTTHPKVGGPLPHLYRCGYYR